jgi:hypothetical protein
VGTDVEKPQKILPSCTPGREDFILGRSNILHPEVLEPSLTFSARQKQKVGTDVETQQKILPSCTPGREDFILGRSNILHPEALETVIEVFSKTGAQGRHRCRKAAKDLAFLHSRQGGLHTRKIIYKFHPEALEPSLTVSSRQKQKVGTDVEKQQKILPSCSPGRVDFILGRSNIVRSKALEPALTFSARQKQKVCTDVKKQQRGLCHSCTPSREDSVLGRLKVLHPDAFETVFQRFSKREAEGWHRCGKEAKDLALLHSREGGSCTWQIKGPPSRCA